MENENPLDKEVKSEWQPPYSENEKEYAGYLQKRMEIARTLRNQNHDEFDGMSYTTYYQTNAQGANSFIPPKKNREDTNFVTGTTRQALLAYVSKINSLNLTPEVKAFNKENKQFVHVGTTLEDHILQANEVDNDDEKRILRDYELYSQGTVFVQDRWVQTWGMVKKGFNFKKWDGQVNSAEWQENLEKVFEGPQREIYPGLNVFMGSITEFDFDKQPYFYTVDYKNYNEAKSIYGEWERWKYVTKKVRYWNAEVPSTLYNNNWRLQNTQDNVVEEIIYRDRWANEFMITLNGVMMMKPGFPLPWDYEGYDMVKQIYEIISTNFAYGGSLIKRLKVSQQLETEFWRLAILKTQKSFEPPRGNMSGQVLGSRIFRPGKITPGINAEMVKPLDENNVGVTSGEVDMMNMLSQNIKDNSVPNLNQQDQQGSNPTATEIMQAKQQADTLMQLALFSATQLERKLSYLRLNILMENGYEPIGTVADTTNMEIKSLFSQVSRNTSIAGKGKGRRITKVLPKGSLPSSKSIFDEQKQMSKDENQPVKIVYLSAEELKETKWTWKVNVTAKEKETSELSRIMFGNMMQQAQLYFQQDLDLSYFEEKFSEAWSLNNDKAFVQKSSQMMGLPQPGMAPGANGQPQPGPSGGLQAGAPNPMQSTMPRVQKQMATMAQR